MPSEPTFVAVITRRGVVDVLCKRQHSNTRRRHSLIRSSAFLRFSIVPSRKRKSKRIPYPVSSCRRLRIGTKPAPLSRILFTPQLPQRCDDCRRRRVCFNREMSRAISFTFSWHCWHWCCLPSEESR